MRRPYFRFVFSFVLMTLIKSAVSQDEFQSGNPRPEVEETGPEKSEAARERERSTSREESRRDNPREREAPPSRGETPDESKGRSDKGREERERGEHGHREGPHRHERGEPNRELGEERERRIRHLFEAAEHLELAGFPGEARHFRERAEEMRKDRMYPHRGGDALDEIRHQLGMIREMMSDLKRENAELREALGDLQRRR